MRSGPVSVENQSVVLEGGRTLHRQDPSEPELNRPRRRTLILALAAAAVLATRTASLAVADSAPDLHLTVRPEPSDVKVGDEVVVDFAVTNAGEREFQYEGAGNDECAFLAGFDLHFTAPDGKTERTPQGAASCVSSKQRLAPGASFHAHVSLNHRAGFLLGPGEYRLTGLYNPSGRPGSRSQWPEVVSPEIVVTVHARTSTEMGTYIDSLKAQLAGLRGGDDDASARYHLVRQLGYTGDPRIIPAVIDAMYAAEGKGGANGAREALVDFLPDKSASLRALLDAGKPGASRTTKWGSYCACWELPKRRCIPSSNAPLLQTARRHGKGDDCRDEHRRSGPLHDTHRRHCSDRFIPRAATGPPGPCWKPLRRGREGAARGARRRGSEDP